MPKRNWEKAFFAALEETGSVAAAAEAAKVDRSNMYHYKKTDPDFAKKWEEALDRGADTLEAEARSRAMDKTATGSHILLMFLLKGLRPQVWRESRSTVPPAELDKLLRKEMDAEVQKRVQQELERQKQTEEKLMPPALKIAGT